MVSHYGHALPYMVAIFEDMAMAIMDGKYSKSIWPYMAIYGNTALGLRIHSVII